MTHRDGNKDVPISATQFPALRDFLRGYLHQDMKDEYGSVPDAVRAFCKDAGPDTFKAVSVEWSRFSALTAEMTLEQINQILTGPLGGSFAITKSDLGEISSILKVGHK